MGKTCLLDTNTAVYYLNASLSEIADMAISIRRKQKIKLPDAVIAATALEYGYTLISRNDADFRNIPGLLYLNPFTDIL